MSCLGESAAPTFEPSAEPSISLEPSVEPNIAPSAEPSISLEPSVEPNIAPSAEPTISLEPSINVVSTASIQIVTFASTTCSGMVAAARTYAADICLPVGIPSGNSSILTKTGNVISAQGYSDFGCSTASASAVIELNTCSIQDESSIIPYADAPNTIPSALFTSVADQVTATYA